MDNSAAKLRLYCETLPFDQVTRPRTLALLRRHDFEVVLAVRPWQLGELPAVARVLRDAGVPCSIWPLPADAEGRGATPHTAPPFAPFVQPRVDPPDAASALPREVLPALKPPFS